MEADIQRKIREKISEIQEKSANGNYIYRGEPKTREGHPHYGKVSSSLWREFGIETEDFNIEVIQTEILRGAKGHIGDLPQDYRAALAASLNVTQEEGDQTIDFEILTEIQHYGGKTNLIDFTTDYLIALFFACDGHHNEKGRVILQKTEEIQDIIERPRNPRHRVIAQKSIFVRPPKGFINKPHEDNVVIIPEDLKQWILQLLQQYRRISKETIYNDVYGFIRHQDIHGAAYTQFYRGFACQKRGDEATTSEEKQQEYEKSIKYYTKAIQLSPNHVPIYNNRGLAYHKICDYDRAIVDFNKVIELNPNYAEAYSNRGLAYYQKGESDHAIEDYTKTIELNPNYVPAYNNRGIAYRQRGDFERAIEDCTRAIELDPNNFDTYGNRGLAYNGKGDYERTIKDFDRVIELKPDDVDAYINRGVAYYKRGDYERAIEDYTKTIELNPNYVEAHYNRGEARLHLEEWERARIDLTYAKDRGLDIIVAFHKEHGSVADFQRETDITLPEDIAEMLTSTQS